MSRTMGFASKGFIAIAGAAVLALTGLGLFAPAAHAAPDSPTDSTGQKQCGLSNQQGVTVYYKAGTKITIAHEDNEGSETYVCNGKTGDWDTVTIVSLPPTRTFRLGSVNLVDATLTGGATSSGTSTFNSTLGTLSR